MTVERLIEVLEEAGLAPESYSGRGMYGKRCVAIVVPDTFRAGTRIGKVLGSDETMPASSEDNMGRDVVVYWSGHEWPAGRADANDEGDDDEKCWACHDEQGPGVCHVCSNTEDARFAASIKDK